MSEGPSILSKLVMHFDDCLDDWGVPSVDLLDASSPTKLDSDLSCLTDVDRAKLHHSLEKWCEGTRHEWARIFRLWMKATWLKKPLPVDETEEFKTMIERRLSKAKGVVQSFAIRSASPSLDDRQWEIRCGQITNYLRSLQKRYDLASRLEKSNPVESFEAVLRELVSPEGLGSLSRKIDLPESLWKSAGPPDSKQTCVHCGILWLIHELAFWLRELRNEAGPWMQALISFHQKMLKSIRSSRNTFFYAEQGIEPVSDPYNATQAQLFSSYLQDELDSLRDLLVPQIMKVRLLGETPPLEGEHDAFSSHNEKLAHDCVCYFVLPAVEERLRSSIRLLNDFRMSLAGSAKRQGNASLFMPHLQWVFVIENSICRPLPFGEAEWNEDLSDETFLESSVNQNLSDEVLQELPEKLRELFQKFPGEKEFPDEQDLADEFSQESLAAVDLPFENSRDSDGEHTIEYSPHLTLDDCNNMLSTYASALNSWFAKKAEELRSVGIDSEDLSVTVRRFGQSESRLVFRPEIMAELAHFLRMGNSNLSDVFDLLHHELVLFTTNSPYRRPWGQLRFGKDNGALVLSANE